MRKSTICNHRFTSDGAFLGLGILVYFDVKLSPRVIAPRNNQRWAIIVGINMITGLRIEVDLQRGPKEMAFRKGGDVGIELFSQLLL